MIQENVVLSLGKLKKKTDKMYMRHNSRSEFCRTPLSVSLLGQTAATFSLDKVLF